MPRGWRVSCGRGGRRDERTRRRGCRDLRRRLELFVAAVFPDAPEIGLAEPPAPRSLLARLADARHVPPAQHRCARLLGRDAHPTPRTSRRTATGAGSRTGTGCWPWSRRREFTAAPLRTCLPTTTAARPLPARPRPPRLTSASQRMFPRFSAGLARGPAGSRAGASGSAPPVAARTRRRAPRAATAGRESRPAARSHSSVAATPEDSRHWAVEQARALASLAGTYRGMAPVPLWGVLP